MDDIEVMWLNDNELKQLPQSIQQMKNLQILYLPKNQFTNIQFWKFSLAKNGCFYK